MEVNNDLLFNILTPFRQEIDEMDSFLQNSLTHKVFNEVDSLLYDNAESILLFNLYNNLENQLDNDKH